MAEVHYCGRSMEQKYILDDFYHADSDDDERLGGNEG
jgi:hypothetical protein